MKSLRRKRQFFVQKGTARNSGIMEHWNDGLTEYQNEKNLKKEYWNHGATEYWAVRTLGRNTPLLQDS